MPITQSLPAHYRNMPITRVLLYIKGQAQKKPLKISEISHLQLVVLPPVQDLLGALLLFAGDVPPAPQLRQLGAGGWRGRLLLLPRFLLLWFPLCCPGPRLHAEQRFPEHHLVTLCMQIMCT